MPQFQLISQELCLAAEELKTLAAKPKNLLTNINRPKRVRKPLVKYSPSDYSTKHKFKFCICKERKQSKTVACSNKRNCRYGQFFHYEGERPCVLYRDDSEVSKKWICPWCKKDAEKTEEEIGIPVKIIKL
jgi:ferredoxin-thioredoxin reductase catalytic subunit